MKFNLFKTKKCDVLSEAIGGIFNIGSTALGGLMANKQAAIERDWNAEQAQINRDFQRDERIAAQEYNLDMWNMNNEYNSPSAQIERALEAGINPNTLFGATTPVASKAPITTPMNGAQATSNIAGALGSQYIGVASALGINTANMLNTLTDRDTKQYWLSYDQMTEGQRKQILNANLNNILKEIEVKDVNIESAKVILDSLAELKEQELLNLRDLAKKIQAETLSIESAIERDDRLADSTIAVNDASIIRNDKLADSTIKSNEASIVRDDKLADSNIAYVEQQQAQSEEQTRSIKLLNDFADAVGAPMGTPEYLFVKKLADENKLDKFLDEVYIPLEQSRWTPSQFSVDNKFGNSTNTEFYFDFHPRKGIVNPSSVDYTTPDDYWEEYYNNRIKSKKAKSKHSKKR